MKKFLSLALAAAMAVGTCVGFAGCDFGGNNDNSGDNGGGNNPGGNTPGGNTPGGEFVVDEKTELLTGAINADITYLTLDANADVSIKTNGQTVNGKVIGSAKADLSDVENPALDAMVSADSGSEGSNYDLLFMRNGYAYAAEGDWADLSNVTVGDFNALLDAYRTSDTLYFNRLGSDVGFIGEANSGAAYESAEGTHSSGGLAGILSGEQFATLPDPSIVIKLVCNVAEVVGCEVKTVSNGYTLDFDLVKSLNTLVEGVGTVLENASPVTKVNDVIANPFITKVLSTLFRGITAQDVFTIMQSQMDDPQTFESITQLLPAPEELSLFDYLKKALNDTTFYPNLISMITGSKFDPKTSPFPEVTCFGDLTVKNIVSLATGSSEVTDEDIARMIGTIKEVVDTLKKDLVGTIASMIVGGNTIVGGKGSGSVDKAMISLLFDSSKNFTGIDVVLSNLKANVTSESRYHDVTTGQEVVNTRTYDISVDGSISVKLVDNVSLVSLKGIKYDTSKVDTTKLKADHIYDTSSTSVYLFPQAEYEGEPVYADISYDVEWDITSDKISVSVVIPQLGLKDLTKEVTLTEIKASLSDENYTVEFPIVPENTQVTYEGQTYYFYLNLEVYSGGNYLNVILSHSNGAFAGETVDYQPILETIA